MPDHKFDHNDLTSIAMFLGPEWTLRDGTPGDWEGDRWRYPEFAHKDGGAVQMHFVTYPKLRIGIGVVWPKSPIFGGSTWEPNKTQVNGSGWEKPFSSITVAPNRKPKDVAREIKNRVLVGLNEMDYLATYADRVKVMKAAEAKHQKRVALHQLLKGMAGNGSDGDESHTSSRDFKFWTPYTSNAPRVEGRVDSDLEVSLELQRIPLALAREIIRKVQQAREAWIKAHPGGEEE